MPSSKNISISIFDSYKNFIKTIILQNTPYSINPRQKSPSKYLIHMKSLTRHSTDPREAVSPGQGWHRGTLQQSVRCPCPQLGGMEGWAIFLLQMKVGKTLKPQYSIM